jgi:hypothetical protein
MTMIKLFAVAVFATLSAATSTVMVSIPASAGQNFPDHGRLYVTGAGSSSEASGPFVNPTQVLRQALVPIQVQASPNAVVNASTLPNLAPRKRR